MAKELVKIGIAFEYDPAENHGLPANIFLFQMINRLNYEFPVKSIRLKGEEKVFDEVEPVKQCALREALTVEGEPYKED